MRSRASLSLLLLLLAAAGAGAGFVLHRAPAASTVARGADPQQKPVYYCPMHPSYRSDRPGNCPVCNMKLVLLEEGAEAPDSSHVAGHATVTIPEERRQLVGVHSEPVERAPFLRTIRVSGRVDVDERKLSAVSLKVGGWIEELLVNATGQTVAVGQPLFRLYSPELYEAQRTFLLARGGQAAASGSASGATSTDALGAELVESARQKLLLWDMSEEQVRELEARGTAERLTPILARSAGVVLRREAVAGARVEAGATLYELADLSTVWIQAALHASDVAAVQVGAEATIELESRPGEALAGRVVYLSPTVDEATRTTRARIEVANEDGRLRPGEYASVSIAVDLGPELAIDEAAVLDTGSRKLVFVDLGEGRYEPREVETGARAGGRVVVSAGLEEGERVLTRGNFLIDSESRLRAALAQHAQHAHAH